MQLFQFRQVSTPKERLERSAKDARDRAIFLPPGRQREELMRFARRAYTTAHLDAWLKSPGLRAPE